MGFDAAEGGDGGGVVELFLPAAGAEGVGVYTGPVVLFLAEAEAEGDVVLLLAEAEAEGVGVLSLSAAGVERVDLLSVSAAGVEGVGVLMSAAGVEGVEGEGVALPFSVEAGTTLAGVNEVRTVLGVVTGLSLGVLVAESPDGELRAEEEEDLIGEGVRLRTSAKETFGVTLEGDSTLNLRTGEPPSLGVGIEPRLACLINCIRLSRVPVRVVTWAWRVEKSFSLFLSLASFALMKALFDSTAGRDEGEMPL